MVKKITKPLYSIFGVPPVALMTAALKQNLMIMFSNLRLFQRQRASCASLEANLTFYFCLHLISDLKTVRS